MENIENERNEISLLQEEKETTKEDFANKIGAIVDTKSGWITFPLNKITV